MQKPGRILRWFSGDRLTRITSGGNYIPELDGLRFIAIVAVVLYHIPGNWLTYGASRYGGATGIPPVLGAFYGLGYEGVLLFFSISGFILSLPFARQYIRHEQAVPLRKFYWRRVTRLEPPYIISLVLLFAFGILMGRFGLKKDAPHLLASLFYVHNCVYGGESTINVAAWSLEIEIQFYLLAPFLARFMFKGRGRRYVLLPCLILFFGFLQVVEPMRVLTLAKFAHYFLAGILAAAIYVEFSEWSRKESRFGDLAAGGCLLVFLCARALGKSVAELLLPWIFGVLLVAIMKAPWCGKCLRRPMVARTGGMCYTIYLYHGRLITIPIVFVLSKLALTGRYSSDILLLTALLVPVVFIISTILFTFLERPFMNPKWPDLLSLNVRTFFGRAVQRAPLTASAEVADLDLRGK